VAQLRVRGDSILALLERLYRRHGLWVSTQRSILRPGSTGRAEIEHATTLAAEAPPAEVAGRRVEHVRDFRRDAAARAPWLGAAPLVELGLEGGARVLVRPSGTEPKLKIYVDLRVELGVRDVVSEREKEALSQAHAVAAALARNLGLE